MCKQRWITYEEFGAIGDGCHDDMEAIWKAHAYANEKGLPVKAKEGASYYIGGRAICAEIQTDTDWTGARILIDDRDVENVKGPVFLVTGKQPSFHLSEDSFQKNQKHLEKALPVDCFVTIENTSQKRYFRFGPNEDQGTVQTDCFVVHADGEIQNEIIWDFPEVTSCVAHPIEEEELTLTGGTFITIANAAESVYNYYSRNIEIHRSRTTVNNLTHFNTEEGESGSPYRGFLSIEDCAFVTVKDSFFTGHKIYETIGSAGTPVSMGSYDINVYRSSDVSFINCCQEKIMDRTRWGLMGTNFCKNLYLEGCVFSRFDAHMGVTNAHLKNCRLGWQCLNLIGHGNFLLEGTEAYGWALVNLRNDYGSTWDGDIVIRSCIWHPTASNSCIISASNSGNHDFGYVCRMPRKLTIQDVRIMDGAFADETDYDGLTVFGDYDPEIGAKDDGTNRPHPYETTKELCISGITTESKKEIRIRTNPYSMPNLYVYDSEVCRKNPAAGICAAELC